MSILTSVDSFGGIDADTDQLLDACFETHDAYRAVLSHQKYLILGRKGSGKTAIFRKLIRANGSNVFSYGHTFSDYPWHYHDKQKKIGVPNEQCFLHSWEYLIYMTLAKVFLNVDQSQPWSDRAAQEVSALETFVVDTYGSRDPDVSQIFSPTRSLRLKPTLGLNWHFVKAEIHPEQVPMDYLPMVIQDVNRRLMEAVVTSANPDSEYFICFDELDLGFSKTDRDYALKLIGLLLAARKINDVTRDAGKKLRVVIFLRDDIYQELQFEDKNKITEGGSARIEWETGELDNSLRVLMEKRFAKVFSIPETGSWAQVFDETRSMSGHQPKYQHIIDRTFLRPRDIIKFCNEVLIAHKKRTDVRPDRFDNEDVSNARQAYSEYFLNELDDEIHKNVPAYKEYLEILKTINSAVFKKELLDEAWENRKEILPPSVSPRDLLAQLFEFSIIGYYRPGGGGGGSDYVWKYRDRRALFNENAATYRVHPGFVEVLGIRRYTWG